MKMSDYFELPVSFDVDLCKIHSPSHNLIEAKAINLEAQCYAINNHDRLAEENAKLLEVLNKIVSESTAVRATPRNTKAVRDQVELGGYIKHFKVETYLINQSVGLLNQLKDQNNDK